jgi:hypothetical protein
MGYSHSVNEEKPYEPYGICVYCKRELESGESYICSECESKLEQVEIEDLGE